MLYTTLKHSWQPFRFVVFFLWVPLCSHLCLCWDMCTGLLLCPIACIPSCACLITINPICVWNAYSFHDLSSPSITVIGLARLGPKWITFVSKCPSWPHPHSSPQPHSDNQILPILLTVNNQILTLNTWCLKLKCCWHCNFVNMSLFHNLARPLNSQQSTLDAQCLTLRGVHCNCTSWTRWVPYYGSCTRAVPTSFQPLVWMVDETV